MTRPQERNQKRLTKFHAFLAAPSTEDRLKRACLCLQLTTHAVALTVTHAPSVPAGVETEPLLVRLAKGEVQQKTIAHLHRLLTLLPLDPDLAIADTVKALLATEAHLILRFNRYAEYPTKILFMCERFNLEGFVREIEVFLMTDDSKLDARIRLASQAGGLGPWTTSRCFTLHAVCASSRRIGASVFSCPRY